MSGCKLATRTLDLRLLYPAWRGINRCRVRSKSIEEVFCDLGGFTEAVDELHIRSGPFPPRMALPPELEQSDALAHLPRKRRAAGVAY